MPDASLIFDRRLVRAHRDRAGVHLQQHDFLLREMASRLCDRLRDINRAFPIALDLGAHHGLLAEYLPKESGIEKIIQTDLSEAMIGAAPAIKLVADEEVLPFAPATFDLVISCGSLHWVNDLPGTLAQIRQALKPDGLFLATLPGGETLKELRHAFEQADMQAGGLSPRISPFIDIRDAGSLLQRAGFTLPVVDREVLTVSYEHPLKLMRDLREMGEANALLHARKSFTPCSLLMSAADWYLREYSDAEGRIPATFELVTLTGWKSHASQQKPAKRGSGRVHLGDALSG